jgi:hypothetical protein
MSRIVGTVGPITLVPLLAACGPREPRQEHSERVPVKPAQPNRQTDDGEQQAESV